jgi:hypothetical protein
MRRRKKIAITNKKGRLTLDALGSKRRLHSFGLCGRALLPVTILL